MKDEELIKRLNSIENKLDKLLFPDLKPTGCNCGINKAQRCGSWLCPEHGNMLVDETTGIITNIDY